MGFRCPHARSEPTVHERSPRRFVYATFVTLANVTWLTLAAALTAAPPFREHLQLLWGKQNLALNTCVAFGTVSFVFEWYKTTDTYFPVVLWRRRRIRHFGMPCKSAAFRCHVICSQRKQQSRNIKPETKPRGCDMELIFLKNIFLKIYGLLEFSFMCLFVSLSLTVIISKPNREAAPIAPAVLNCNHRVALLHSLYHRNNGFQN